MHHACECDSSTALMAGWRDIISFFKLIDVYEGFNFLSSRNIIKMACEVYASILTSKVEKTSYFFRSTT